MSDMPVKRRNRILSLKDRRAIIQLYERGGWTMQQLADLFSVSQPRISQLVNDTYGERGSLNEEQ